MNSLNNQISMVCYPVKNTEGFESTTPLPPPKPANILQAFPDKGVMGKNILLVYPSIMPTLSLIGKTVSGTGIAPDTRVLDFKIVTATIDNKMPPYFNNFIMMKLNKDKTDFSKVIDFYKFE